MPEHDGTSIPTVDPKDPNSIKALYSFTYSLADGEVISTSTWLINGVLVSVGDEVDGLTLGVVSSLDGVNKAGLTGGILHKRYTITNRTSTNIRDIDDKSCYLKIKNL